jgi:uncharacterized membrane protein YdbT with pleckstrin-like domain
MDLRADERALFEGRPSWRALMTFYVAGIGLAIVVVVVLGFLVDEMSLAIGIAAVIVALTLLIGFFRRVGTKYLLTTQRLRISRGIVRKNVQETRLDRVQNVNYSQGVLDRMFGVGTVDFDTAGTDDSEFRFEWINDPETVVRAVDEATHEASQQPQSLEPPAAQPPAS